jgi:hypothetical protein
MIQFGSYNDIFWLSTAKVYHLDALLMTVRQAKPSFLFDKGPDVVT